MYRAYHLSLYCTPFEELLKRKGEEWRGMERYRGLHLSFDCTPFEELLKRRGEEWRGKERERVLLSATLDQLPPLGLDFTLLLFFYLFFLIFYLNI